MDCTLLSRITYHASLEWSELMAETTRAVVIRGVNDVRVEEIPVPELAPEEIRVRVKYSGISVGTERWIVTGQRPDAPFPMIPGYQNCGVVEAVGSLVKNVQA